MIYKYSIQNWPNEHWFIVVVITLEWNLQETLLSSNSHIITHAAHAWLAQGIALLGWAAEKGHIKEWVRMNCLLVLQVAVAQ